jgi:outer membrane protein assembly factor BamE (lipoprotein component of BamABCDE complex)
LHVNHERNAPGGRGLHFGLLRGTSTPKVAQGRLRAAMSVRRNVRPLAVMAVLALGLALGGCFTQTYQRGYVLADGALEQIPLGAPQEQVLITLGTPSTVATVSGEVFYYISARTEQTSFLPEKTVDQRVVAVYFDKNRRVQRIANYGLQDGKIFDYVTRTTPTSGQELSYLTYVFKIFGK